MPETTDKPKPTGRVAAKAQGDVLETERTERIEKRDNPGGHPNLASALVAFQAEMPTVAKGNTARIPGKNGSAGYSYKYADLGDVTAAAIPVLGKHGLAFVCVPTRIRESGAYELVGTLMHALGETLEGGLPVTGRHDQEIGSSLTYGRRYLLGTMTGLVTDEDEDGTIAAQNQQRTQAAAEPPHVAVLRGSLEGLTAENQQAIRAWWPQGMPRLEALNADQAATVMAEVDRLSNPWANEQPQTDPWATPAQGAQDPQGAR